jgi:hypothetical protein
MILLRESGMAQPAIAEAMGVSLSTVNRAHMATAMAASKLSSRSRAAGAIPFPRQLESEASGIMTPSTRVNCIRKSERPQQFSF